MLPKATFYFKVLFILTFEEDLSVTEWEWEWGWVGQIFWNFCTSYC